MGALIELRQEGAARSHWEGSTVPNSNIVKWLRFYGINEGGKRDEGVPLLHPQPATTLAAAVPARSSTGKRRRGRVWGERRAPTGLPREWGLQLPPSCGLCLPIKTLKACKIIPPIIIMSILVGTSQPSRLPPAGFPAHAWCCQGFSSSPHPTGGRVPPLGFSLQPFAARDGGGAAGSFLAFVFPLLPSIGRKGAFTLRGDAAAGGARAGPDPRTPKQPALLPPGRRRRRMRRKAGCSAAPSRLFPGLLRPPIGARLKVSVNLFASPSRGARRCRLYCPLDASSFFCFTIVVSI